MGENVGFAARAMKNFGFHDLRLIAPGLIEDNKWEAGKHNTNFNLSHFLEKAEAVAKSGSDIVKNAKIFSSITEASFDINRIYALSARRREIAKEIITPGTFVDESKIFEGNIGILFGAEASGLSNHDISLAYKIVEIETEKGCSSINLGMSVGIICHALFAENLKYHFKTKERGIGNKANLKTLHTMLNFLERKLESANYFKVEEKQHGQMINLQNLFTRQELTEAECQTLIGIFNLIKNPLNSGENSEH